MRFVDKNTAPSAASIGGEKMEFDEERSEFECVVLGLLAMGQNTGYRMRKELLRMRGHRWSVESGSVYRALRRLDRDGFVEELGRTGVARRERIEYRITAAGESALQQWLQQSLTSEELEECSDPMRTRTYFLSMLPPERRLLVARKWLNDSRQLVTALRQGLLDAQDSDPMRQIAYRSFVIQAEARQEWLRHLVAYLRPAQEERKPAEQLPRKTKVKAPA